MKRFEFEVNDQRYFIEISQEVLNKAKFVQNKAFKEALESGALLRQGLMKYMKEQGVWDDTKEKQYEDLLVKIAKLENQLSSGGMKVSEGKKIALQLSKVRADFRELISERNMMDGNTAEGQADNAKFNYMLSASVFSYDTQKPVYASLEDYVQNGSSSTGMAIAGKFASYLYGIDENYENSLLETKFLKRFKLIDDKGRFIDKSGNLVDVEGHRVDEEGFRIDSEGRRIDMDGVLIVKADIETVEFEED